MAFIDRIVEANHKIQGRGYYRLLFNHQPLGFVDQQLLTELDDNLFTTNHQQQQVAVQFPPQKANDCSEAIEAFFKGYFAKQQLNGWRNERYAIRNHFCDEPVLLLERSVLSYLGLTGYGVHINGYTQKNGELFMWVAKRSADKPTAPGKLDQIAAGGQPHDKSLFENVIKECEEEANIPEALAKTAKPVSAISYWYDMKVGARPDIIFNYDLQLPPDFMPAINDDEVESFQLMPIREVLNLVETSNQFKINSALVVIDFAIRHGVIEPHHPDYIELQQGMNQRHQGIAFYSR